MHAPSPFTSHLGDLPMPADSVADGVMATQGKRGLGALIPDRRTALLLLLGLALGVLLTLVVQKMMKKKAQ